LKRVLFSLSTMREVRSFDKTQRKWSLFNTSCISSLTRKSVSLNQEELLIRAAQRNHKAFGPLYERYFDAVFGFVLNRTMNYDLAGDLTSQTFIKAMHSVRKYELRGVPFQFWLFRIALNEIRMFFRKHPNIEVPLTEVKLDQLLSDAEATDNNSGREDQRQVLIKALNQLNQEEVELIEMRFFEERSFKEVALMLGCAEDAAKKRVYRIVAKLRTMMGGKS
jgi:RNA polymerase sigma-70 factor (ECF subfamily)